MAWELSAADVHPAGLRSEYFATHGAFLTLLNKFPLNEGPGCFTNIT